MAKKLKVTLTGSRTGCVKKCKLTIDALGLGKKNSFKIHPDNGAIRGMIFQVKHVLSVEEIEA